MTNVGIKKSVAEAAGWYGTVAIVSAYFLVSFDVVGAKSVVYQLLNLTGAAGIIAVSATKGVFQPVVLNTVWAVVALVALLSML